MRDLNFFEGYVEKREFKLNTKLIYFVAIGFCLLFLIGYIGYNAVVIKEENEMVNTLKQEAENPSVLSKVEEIKEKEEQLNNLKESVDKIVILDTDVAATKKIDDTLLEEINDKIPNNIFLTSISIEEERISIVGISKDKWAIPEFQKSLASLDDYGDVFVPYITLEDNQYNFALEVEKRGVVEDEGTDEE